MSSINEARKAEQTMIQQIHATAEALAQIGQDDLSRAMAHLKHEAESLKVRLASAHTAMCDELSAVLAQMIAYTNEMEEGLQQPQEECPLLGVQAVNLPSADDVTMPTVPTVAQEQPQRIDISVQDMQPLAEYDPFSAPTVNDVPVPTESSTIAPETNGHVNTSTPAPVPQKGRGRKPKALNGRIPAV